jgi:hypothetical protein
MVSSQFPALRLIFIHIFEFYPIDLARKILILERRLQKVSISVNTGPGLPQLWVIESALPEVLPWDQGTRSFHFETAHGAVPYREKSWG